MGYIGNKPTALPITTSDLTDGLITTAKIANDAVDNTKLDLTDNYAFTGTVSGTGGITEAVLFRLATGVTGDVDPITSWEVADDSMAGRIGTGITQSSGIFSFSSTGIYLIEFQGSAYDSGADDVQINIQIYASSDSGSTYDRLAQAMTNLHHSAQHSFSVNALVDITNTTTDRIKFITDGNNGELNASTNQNYTFVSFLRLGDT